MNWKHKTVVFGLEKQQALKQKDKSDNLYICMLTTSFILYHST